MIQYQSTPDYYREYIEHGWAQNAANKAHKYIDKYMKNGKWIYRYKSKAQELGTKINRKLSGANADQISLNYGKEPIHGYSRDNGKATSRTGTRGNFQNWKGKDVVPASGHTDGLRVRSGIEAGRQRARKKGVKIKGYTGNLSSRGYSNSNQPKGYESTTIKGKTVRSTVYDSPSFGETLMWPKSAAEKKRKNDAKVSRGINAGRQRVAKKKKK